MTAYALATALLAPLAVVATGHWPRKRALLAALAVYALGNAVCAAAVNLPMFLGGRVLMGVGAAFSPIAAGIALASVEPARQGRALALVFLGISLSYVVGVPLGAWLGLRHGWPVPIAVVALATFACMVLLALRLPARLSAPGASFAGVGRLLRDLRVLNALALTLLYFTAIFLVFSYIGPVLKSLVPMDASQLSLTLMLFGLSGVVGTLLGGWENDRFGWRRTLVLHLAVLATTMALVPLTHGSWPALMAVFLAWGIAGFGMMTPQQSRLASLAPEQAPLLLSLNASMLYLGTALGAATGGLIAPWTGFDRLAWVGAPLALIGLATLAIGLRGPGATPAMPR
jgi:DHA1 family inner membrane transport protein